VFKNADFTREPNLLCCCGRGFLNRTSIKELGYVPRLSGKTGGISGETALASFFALLWGWADYNPKDWSSTPYKRGYGDERRRSTIVYR
jgi:hypothetical protein